MVDSRLAQVIRIGMQFISADPFWVMVREGIYQRAEQLQVTLVPVEVDLWPLSGEKQMEVIEEILALDLHGLVTQGMGATLARLVADAGVPGVFLTETDLQHRLVSSPRGLYEAARMAALFVADNIDRRGQVVIVGGLAEGFDRGYSRLDGFRNVMDAYPEIDIEHISTPWAYQPAFEQTKDALSRNSKPLSAIFGLSDPTALAGQHAAKELGLIDDQTVVVGINGDPLALAAIMGGSMTATVETPAIALGRQAIDLVVGATHGQPLPRNFDYHPRLITRENVAQVSTEKLMAMASLPGRLVGINRHQEQERLVQLETSLEISRQIGSILDRQQLYYEIVDLIRANYGYDEAQIFMWSMHDREFLLDKLGTEPKLTIRIPLAESGLLGYTFLHNQPTFIPDMRFSHRFPPDPYWPATRSRVILLIHQGSTIIGLLDLHSRRPIHHSSSALIGLQALADQLGAALRNAELYGEAVAARAQAERANLLKSRLYANISHGFRTPLNVIEGYSQAALATPGLYGLDLPPALLKDLSHIYTSSEHLERLINDLLDLSKAEIGELDLLAEPMNPRGLIEEAFEIMAGSRTANDQVIWRLLLPERLPEVYADPVRLRQILLNLLSNAGKFTAAGSITLGVQAEPEHLHIWVEDTGSGIAPQFQQRIFEAFSTAELPRRPEQGIGLGLRVTHALVRLHGGAMTLASKPGIGTTFHVYLPLPTPESLAAHQASKVETGQIATLALHPDALPPQVSSLTRQTVAWFCEHYADTLSREEVAESLGVTAGYLTSVFRKELGLTPWEYLTRLRMAHAKELLISGSESIAEVAGRVGYDDPAYFTRVFLKETGHAPRAFRKLTRGD